MSKYTFLIELFNKNKESLGRYEAKFDLVEFRVFVEVNAFIWRTLSATKLLIIENESGVIFSCNPQKLDVDSLILYDSDSIEISHSLNILGNDKPIVYTDDISESLNKKLIFNREL